MKDRHLFAACLMILGMFAFPIGDATAKFLSSDYSPVLLTWAKFTISLAILLPCTLFFKSKPVVIDRRTIFEQVIRAVFIFGATIFFIAAIAEIPLADAVGAYFTAPIIAGVLAVIFLGEKFSFLKAIATALGFVGMLLIVKPGASIEIGFIYALLAGLCFGAFLVATRWSIREVPAIKVAIFQTFCGAAVLTPFALPEISSLRFADSSLLLIVGVASVVGQILVISAARLAPSSLLAPLIYFEIVGAVLFGFIVFGDIPSLLTVIGIGVVMLSGLLLIERRAVPKI